MAVQAIDPAHWQALTDVAETVQQIITEALYLQAQAAKIQVAQRAAIARLEQARTALHTAANAAQASITPDMASGEVQRLQSAQGLLAEAMRAVLVPLQHAADRPALDARTVNLDIPARSLANASAQIAGAHSD